MDSFILFIDISGIQMPWKHLRVSMMSVALIGVYSFLCLLVGLLCIFVYSKESNQVARYE